MIYLDNAATTMRKPQEVIDAVVAAMSSMGNAGRGVNDASLSASRIIYDTRERICRMVNGTDPRQVVFTCNSMLSLRCLSIIRFCVRSMIWRRKGQALRS